MKIIYLSPHLDDAVYSCGGKIWQDVRRGNMVEIWTIFAGDPAGELSPLAQELHARWGVGTEAVRQRRVEDEAACKILGATFCHLAFPDCIYRRLPETGAPVIQQNDDLFGPIREGEKLLVQQIAADLVRLNPERHLMFCPLSIGGHMDHRLTRAAAESTGLPLAYYADFPYAAEKSIHLRDFIPSFCERVPFSLDEEALTRWAEAVAAHASQLSSFWTSAAEMRQALREYSRLISGSSYWKC